MRFQSLWDLANAVYEKHEVDMDNRLKHAAEEIIAITQQRYELTPRKGQATLSVIEMAGIIALALDLDRPGEPFKSRSS